MIEVSVLRPDEDHEWASFIAGCPGALVYHSIGFRDLLADHLGCRPEYLVARESGEVRGVLPLMWSGSVCNSLPYYGSHGGPIAADEAATRALLGAWSERALDPSTSAATLVSNPFLDRPIPEPAHTLTDERVSQVTRLPAGENDEEAEVLAAISGEARSNIRKARRLGVEVTHDNAALDQVSAIHQRNMRRIGGRAKSPEFFELVRAHLVAGRDYDAWTARIGDEVAAALLVLRFNGTVEYFTSGTLEGHRRANPHALLLFEAMTDAVRRGDRLWNWGATWTAGQEGVYRFKRKWGAAESRYSYFVQVNDTALFSTPAEKLLERHPHFYVLPFSALRPPLTRATGAAIRA